MKKQLNSPSIINMQTVNLKIEKELFVFLSERANKEGLSVEEYTANIISKQSNIEEILEDIKHNKTKYSLSRIPMEENHNYMASMDVGCSTIQVDSY